MKTWYFVVIAVIAVIAFFVIPPVVLAQVPPPPLPQDQGSVSQAMLDTETSILAELRSIDNKLDDLLQQDAKEDFVLMYQVDQASLSCESRDNGSMKLLHTSVDRWDNHNYLVWHEQDLAYGNIQYKDSSLSGIPFFIYNLQLINNGTSFEADGIVNGHKTPCSGSLEVFPVKISGSCSGINFKMIGQYPNSYNVTADTFNIICHDLEV